LIYMEFHQFFNAEFCMLLFMYKKLEVKMSSNTQEVIIAYCGLACSSCGMYIKESVSVVIVIDQ